MTQNQTPTQPPIRTRADGSIDFAYYIERGRRMRGQQAYRLIGLDRR